MKRNERTIRGSFSISGIGIHSGEASRVVIRPGEPGQGIVFVRDGVRIPARMEFIRETPRCTRLGVGDVTVSTVEHVLAACMGMRIDCLTVEVEGPELPILDGSSMHVAEKMALAGMVELDRVADPLVIEKTIIFSHNDSFIVGMPSQRFSAALVVDYAHPVVGVQGFYYDPDRMEFEKELAPARTFGFKEELEALLERKLALGGSLDNALIVERTGYMNPPRFHDEVVRHKCLDLLGDLALAGTCIEGHVFAYKPGHLVNSGFSRELAGLRKVSI